jgi:peptidoglycan hydrolase FlgJ
MSQQITALGGVPPDGNTSREARKAWATAQNFESVLLNSLMAPVFDSFEGDGPLGGDTGAGGEAWRGMLVEEYAKGFAGTGGIGLSKDIYRELMRLQEAAGSPAKDMP